ncbi:TAXI family TRAP transporter solute-binding subunit [Clostridium sp. AM58-1XD]|uniref:TAXI family TRAP transporter solute-binding subunit n=1 Tax=Clostridium sp. AM58-1XD TaxID=2292307 RepID=UPI000E4F6FD8|nr:TAXI family TRAP transporter solute-binding subunit [Clostridium sp. AM58-1XD]RGZ00694.1 hypothetical protein DXA13_04555 [Clostridium sp. AM58-1XD]
MKKSNRILAAVLAGMMTMSLAACSNAPAAAGSSDSAAESSSDSGSAPAAGEKSAEYSEEVQNVNWPKFVTVEGASSGGNAYLSISAICQLLTDKTPATFTAQVTPGASQNMYLFEAGEAQFGWGGQHHILFGQEGMFSYAADPVSDVDMKLICQYSVNRQQIAVRKGTNITCIEDLKGKKVVVGAAGSGTESQIRSMMTAMGMYTEKDGYAFEAEYSGIQEGCDLITNGLADAAIIGGTIPLSAYTELFLTDKIELIGFTEEEQKKCVDANIGVTAMTIPAGSYDGKVTEDLLTVGDLCGLVCTSDADEDMVYAISKILVENWDVLGGYHDMFNNITPEEAFTNYDSTYAVPHPGAQRLIDEMGWKK